MEVTSACHRGISRTLNVSATVVYKYFYFLHVKTRERVLYGYFKSTKESAGLIGMQYMLIPMKIGITNSMNLF